jgi:hypothetical protein
VKIDVEDDGRRERAVGGRRVCARRRSRIIQELTATPETEQDLPGQGAGGHYRLRRVRPRSCRAPTACCTSRKSPTTA